MARDARPGETERDLACGLARGARLVGARTGESLIDRVQGRRPAQPKMKEGTSAANSLGACYLGEMVRRNVYKKANHAEATMQTISRRSATLPYKHSASRPSWLAATHTSFTLQQTSAAAAPPATPGSGVATRPFSCGCTPPCDTLSLPSMQRPREWQQEITAGGEEGDAGAPHSPPLALQRQYMAQQLAHPPARPRAGRGRPDRRAPTGDVR